MNFELWTSLLRLPLTIWRYLTSDLLRLVVLSAGVVVVVACFAVAVKPLADGRLGPIETLKYMLLAAIPMLQYALPFAGGFAATLVYHRFAQDNEAIASYAGGVSHRAVLAPALWMALALAAILGVLIDQAMPRLLRNMDRLIVGDLGRLLEASVNRGEAMRLPGSSRFLFANQFVPLPASSGADQTFLLRGLLVVETDDKGRVKSEASASEAYVWLFVEEGSRELDSEDNASGSTRVVMKLRDAVAARTNRAQVDESTISYTVPGRFTEDPKYLTWGEMNQAYEKPELLSGIDRRRRALARVLSERLTADVLRTAMQPGGRLELTSGAGRTVVIRGSGIEPGGSDKGFEVRPLESGTPDAYVEVTSVLEDGRTRLHRARRAYLSQPDSPDATSSVLNLRLEEVRISGPGARDLDIDAPPGPSAPGGAAPAGGPEQTGVRESYDLEGLVPAADPLSRLLALPRESLESEAAARLQSQRGAGVEDRPLSDEFSRLQRNVRETRREITSKQHERVASVLACVVSVLTGAIIALRLRDSLPLPVYLWSFLPSVAAMMSINGGQKIASDAGSAGLVLLYGGVAALAGLAIMGYLRLARH